MQIRLMTNDDSDQAFQREMLMEAAYWREARERPALEVALAEPELAKLVVGWGKPGDVGYIAVDSDNRRIGAAWYRFWSDEEHSWGYVAKDAPELAVGIVAQHRGQGVGRALLLALLRHAADAGVARVSLSVERDNPAQYLYEKLGFERVGEFDEEGTDWVMVAPTDLERAD